MDDPPSAERCACISEVLISRSSLIEMLLWLWEGVSFVEVVVGVSTEDPEGETSIAWSSTAHIFDTSFFCIVLEASVPIFLCSFWGTEIESLSAVEDALC